MSEHDALKDIINKLCRVAGRKGFLTYFEISQFIPDHFGSELMDELFIAIGEMGIKVVDEGRSELETRYKEPFLDGGSSSKFVGHVDNIYLDDISERELNRLFLKISSETAKSGEARDGLISANCSLVSEIAKEYLDRKPSSIGLKDLIQEGYLGLLTAATKYEPEDEKDFSTYAGERIRDFIARAVDDEQRLCSSNVYDIGLRRLDSSEVLWKWKDKEEELYIAKVGTITESPKGSYSDLTSISRIQIPNIPKLDSVDPRLTRFNISLLEIKDRVEKNKRAIPKERGKELFSSEGSSDRKVAITPSDETLPVTYGGMRFDNDRRLSLYAKIVGERAEEIVIKYMGETLLPHERDSIRWISKGGETPGWDIEYVDHESNLVAIEVKGTTGAFFPNVEITANEWNAANEMKAHYWIYLVTKCFSTNPEIQKVQNPVSLKESGILRVTPVLWKIEMLSS